MKDATRRGSWQQQSPDLSQFYQDIPVGLCSLDLDLRYVHINEWLAAINGISVQEHLGRTIGEVLVDVAAGVESLLRQVIETGEPVLHGTVEAETPAQPGVKRIFQHSYLPVKSDDDTIIGVTCVVQDITEREQAERELKESEERFDLAVRATSDGIWDWNIVTNEEYYAPRWCEILGYSHDDPELPHVYDSWASRIHPDDSERVMQAVKVHLETGKVYDVDYRHRHKSGEYRWQNSRGQAIFDKEQKPVRMVGCIRDITERKCFQEQLQRQQTELAHMSRLSTMGEMVTSLAHELNQPLYAISNYVEGCLHLLENGTAETAELIEALEKSASQAQRAAQIIRRLRSFVRPREPRRSSTNINELVRTVVELVDFEIRHYSVSLRLELDERLPLVLCDSIQMQQVIVNLVCNATEAMLDNEPDTRVLTIATSLSEGRTIDISVGDTGHGLAAETGENIFDAFVTTKPEGMGMGLTISRSIVEAHEGRLRAASNPDGGATFQFTLPVEGVWHDES